MLNLLNRLIKTKWLYVALLATLLSYAAKNFYQTSQTLALQEEIIRRDNDASDRHQEWLQRQENIEQQRQQQRQQYKQQYQQRLQTYDRKLEQSRQEHQQHIKNQNELRQRVEQQQQRYRDELRQRQEPYLDRYRLRHRNRL